MAPFTNFTDLELALKIAVEHYEPYFNEKMKESRTFWQLGYLMYAYIDLSKELEAAKLENIRQGQMDAD